MRGNKRRAIALLLTLLLVFGLVPAPVSGTLAPGLQMKDIGSDTQTALPDSLTDGAIWTDKSVNSLGNGEFEITLKALGQDYKLEEPEDRENIDVVLVLDVSGSMEGSRLTNMKAAASSAADILLGAEGNRVAVVKYSDDAETVQDFTTTSAVVSTKINSLSAGGGTNIQKAFYLAQRTIELREDATNKPIIILMSDGQPTYYYNGIIGVDSPLPRQGEGYSSETNGAYVWNTVKQAMHAKNSIQGLDIYTIGFGVSASNAYAVATLQPTEENTRPYRPFTTTYTGESRSVFESGTFQFQRTSSNAGNKWSDWILAQPQQAGYVSPVSTKAYGTWGTFSSTNQPPTASWNPIVITGVIGNISFTDNQGNNRRQIGYAMAERSGFEYQKVNSSYGRETFNHKYWHDASTLSSDSAAGIFNAFVEIVNQLVNYKPMSYTVNSEGNKEYSGIQIQDILGNGFDVVGPLPEDVTQNGNTITWNITADDFKTMEPGSTNIPNDKINQISFKVKISDSATEGTYFTNTSAQGIFAAADNNPAYPGEKVQTQNLPNKGWLTIWAPPVSVELTINKTVTGPVSGNRTFDFGIYYDQGGTDLAYSTPVSITVDGQSVKSEIVNLTLPASSFNNGIATLYVRENSTTSDEFWKYDDDVKTVTISEGKGSVSFTNTYDPKGTLTVKKKWNGGDSTTSVAFELQEAIAFNDDKEPTKWKHVSSGHTLSGENWEVKLSNLNLDTYYRVVEGPMQDYEIIYDPAYIVFDESNLQKTINITNKYQTPKGKITLNKVWEDSNNEAGDRPDQIVFDYTGPTSGQLILTKDSGWTNSLETTAFGTYTFTEAVPQDYKASESALTATISQEPLEARETSLTFTNIYVEPKGKLTVSKEWKDDQGKEIYRPGFIKIQLFRNDTVIDAQGNSTDSSVPVGGERELNEGNQWKYDFTDLMFGKYWVEEITIVPDYTTSYSALEVTLEKGTLGDISKRTGGITITNTFTNPKGEITVTKNWIESGVDRDLVRPDEITVTLMKGTEPAATATLSALNDWETSFKNLELDGSVYTITESATNPEDAAKLTNYNQTIVYGGNGGSENGMTISKDKRTATATLTNTYAKGTITVTKDWKDNGNPTEERPDKATITLYKVVKTIIEENVTEIVAGENDTTTEAIVTTTREAIDRTVAGTRTLDRSASPASLTTVFYDLEMGENISYEVVEDSIPFYDTKYSEESLSLTAERPNGSVTVTNAYTDPKGLLTVYKTWNHGFNPNPENKFTIELYKNGEKIMEKTGTGSSITFDDLNLKATYMVKEKAIDNYNSSGLTEYEYKPVKGSSIVESGSVTVTNTYIPEVGSLQVNKKWVGTTGDAITVTIYRTSRGIQDPNFSKSIELNEGNKWQNTFHGLELYGPNGPYRYEARESGNLGLYDVTNNQTPTLNAGKAVTISITNTYSPEAKGTLVIQKKWLGTDGQPIIPPVGSIQVFLKINETEEAAAMVLNAGNNWTFTRTGLNADPGINYTVREAGSPEEFEVTVSGDGNFTSQNLTKNIIITNTMTEDNPKLEVTKKAIKNTGFLEEGRATFTYNVTLENTGNRTLGNLYILDDMVPTGAAVGASIAYNPISAKTEDGKVRFDLPENLTLAPGKSTTFTYSVTVDKAGAYDNTATAYGSYKTTSVSGEDGESVLVKAPGLSILKEVIGPTTITGTSGTFTYQITVKNDGEVDLTNVKVKDVMTLVSNSAAVYSFGGTGNISFDEGTKVFTIGNLAAESEENIVFTYTVNLNQPGTYNNTATVTGEYTDAVNGEEGQTATIQKQLTDSDSTQVRIVPPTRPNPPNPPGGPGNPDNPVDIPDQEIPLIDNPAAIPDVIIPDDEVPLGEMPKTGGVPAALFLGLGALAAGSGLWLRRKEKGEKILDK
jgi:uncharacterized repeat protein (TIGR01451 family)/LPXTG-motif cell wall-anchored protein